MTTLDDFEAVARADANLAVISTLRADGSIQSSLVNVAVTPHPFTGEPAAAFVTYGAVKLGNLRRRPQITITATNGGAWVALEGRAELIGPDDPPGQRDPSVDPERLRLLLREVFVAAGGTHDDWDEYDRVMSEQRRTAVFVVPVRVYSNH